MTSNPVRPEKADASYEAEPLIPLAPHFRYRVGEGRAGRVHLEGDERSFTLLERPPTESSTWHSLRPTTRRSTPSTERRRRGLPRQRHARRAARVPRGYNAAFALDPDGNNIEAICHKPG